MLLRPTLRLLAQQAYKPSIRFPDRSAASKQDDGAHEAHPHPAAPPEVVKEFDHFKEVLSSGPHFHPEKLQQASADGSSGGGGSGDAGKGGKAAAPVAQDLHDLAPRYWRTSSLAFEEDEMEAVMTGGASLRA
ncbi:hypothetical protein OC842_005142 [Tilletia horrida]|uniref:Uncharacterized protein n=1 Tax=Tilletia horrida TaxID=155126 RepID=A0AAN6JJ91_9BASI|nr:hypothetical protein OC842_005142 [Tilletia horrida]